MEDRGWRTDVLDRAERQSRVGLSERRGRQEESEDEGGVVLSTQVEEACC